MTRAKLNIGLDPILTVFCKHQPAFSLLLIDEGLFCWLCTTSADDFVSNHPRCALHPSWHCFCKSLDVILQLLSDIQMSWQSSRSVESRFCPQLCCPHCLKLDLWTAVFEILRMKPSFKTFLFNSFGMVNSYYVMPIIFEVLIALFLPSSCSCCKRTVMTTAVVFILFLVK